MSYVSDWSKPAKLGATIVPALKATITTWTENDLSCLLSLFFDNLATLVGTGGVLVYVIGSAVSEVDLAKTILSRRVLPACGIMLFIGNFYMSWLATRMKTQYGRDFTAQPYGINTVGAYPFLFDIMLPIALGAPANGTDIGTPLETAWKAGCTGNFIVGIINVVLGCVFLIKPAADFILKWVPIASFVVPVAGVGLTWLALNQIGPNFATPVAGYVPVFLIFVMYFSSGSGSPIKIGKFGLPRPLHWVIYGAALGYAYKLTNVQGDNYQYTYPGGGAWAGGAFVQGFSQLGQYMGTIIPLAIVATMGDVMCLVGAYNAGDPYPISETLIADGLFTMIGSILGSPFGTVVYFGHPVHKRLGGKVGYSFVNGIIYLILTLTGILAFVIDISPLVMVGPTIMVFGVMLAQECTRFMPRRHHGIIFFCLFFGYCDYFAGGVAATSETGIGINVMKKGALLTCMIWAGMLSYALDSRWLPAAAAAGVGAVFAFFGLIGNNGINFDTLMYGSMPAIGSTDPASSASAHYGASAFQTFLGYLTLVATCLLWHFMQGSSAFDIAKPIMPGSEAEAELEASESGKMLFSIGSLNDWWQKAAADGGGKATAEA